MLNTNVFIKKIDGKEYIIVAGGMSHNDAKKLGDKMKSCKFYTRVVPIGKHYTVYSRNKNEKVNSLSLETRILDVKETAFGQHPENWVINNISANKILYFNLKVNTYTEAYNNGNGDWFTVNRDTRPSKMKDKEMELGIYKNKQDALNVMIDWMNMNPIGKSLN